MISVVPVGFLARPVPNELLDKVVCTECTQHPARWEITAAGAGPAQNFACSFCLLYKLPSMAEQRASVDRLIVETEKCLGRSFARIGSGQLRDEEDADRIAFGVVAGMRVYGLQRGQIPQLGTGK